MRLAVSEQWGGAESSDKRDFLISHLADTYAGTPPVEPDLDDLSDVILGYFGDEYETRLEDDSADYVAGRIVALHKLCFGEDTQAAEQSVLALEQSLPKGAAMQVKQGVHDDDAGMRSDDDDEDRDEDGMDVDEPQQQPAAPRQRQEPVVDEDGFTTVVKGRRR